MQCSSKKELLERYLKEIGTPDKMARIDSLWAQRRSFRNEAVPNTVKIGSKTQALTPEMRSDLPDVGETLVKIHNQLAELIVVQKETLELFKKIDGKKE